jgi:hemolysin III
MTQTSSQRQTPNAKRAELRTLTGKSLGGTLDMSPMTKTLARKEPQQSLGEEIANTASSGLCLLAIIAGIPFLLDLAIQRGNLQSLAGTVTFTVSMVVLYLASTIYHALPYSRIKELFRLLDHSAIYLFIAGTYTPFTLGALRGGWGWTLFGFVWGLAILGIGFTLFGRLQNHWFSTWLYLGLGWIGLFAIRPFWQRIPLEGLLWIAAGGLAYTAGVIFYLARRVRYAHFIWHLFVAAGTACHFWAVLWFAS